MTKPQTKDSDVSKDSEKWPKTAKALLEKRYQCFEKGETDFILESHHPDTRGDVEKSAIENWSLKSKWGGLKVGEIDEKGDKTFIRFAVVYERGFEKTNHTEVAEFRKHEGRWYYFDSDFPSPETIKREGEKLGRNDPCHCGSGKKYKKCHARGQGT